MSDKSVPTFPNTVRYAILLPLAAVFLAPFAWLASTSLKTLGDVYHYPPRLWTGHPQWANYTTVLRDASMLRYLANSFFVSISATALQTAVASLAAFALVSFTFRGKRALFGSFLASMMLPGTVTLIPLFVVVRKLGWIDTYTGLIVPFAFSAFSIFLLRQYFLGLPRDIFDAASLDGCGPIRSYCYICLPMALPAMATAASLSFVGFWNDLLWPLVIINSDSKMTFPVGLASFAGQNVSYPQLIMTGVVIGIAPALVVFLALQRYLIRGIALPIAQN